VATPLDELEMFLETNKFHFAMLETDGQDAISAVLDTANGLESKASRPIAAEYLRQYRARAEKMPLAEFLQIGKPTDFAPEALANHFQVDLPEVFHRLASLPPGDGVPEFGLVVCDLSGAVTFRKSLPGFPLPRYGAACPLWPLYQSMAQPHAPLKALLETPENNVFAAHAQCLPTKNRMYESPQFLQASMLFRAAPRGNEGAGASTVAPALKIGLNCRICPRENCEARREVSIHGASD
jgi:predicted transcriptional regulator